MFDNARLALVSSIVLTVACESGPKPKAATPPGTPQGEPTRPSETPTAPSRAQGTRDSPNSEVTDWSGPVFEGTAGIVDVQHEGPPALLTDVRSASHPGYDRFVWQFQGVGVPGYHLEYVDKPVRKCGSGQVTSILGDAWLEVRLYPANAHTEAGAPTVAERDRQLTLEVAKELESTCDFEAVVTWVIGVEHPNHYRVLELENPARLVVDIRH